MTFNEVKDKARDLGIKVGKLKKADLILAIQKSEGNNPCFGTGTEACDQYECSWRKDCIGK